MLGKYNFDRFDKAMKSLKCKQSNLKKNVGAYIGYSYQARSRYMAAFNNQILKNMLKQINKSQVKNKYRNTEINE